LFIYLFKGVSGLSRRHGFKCSPDDNVSIEDVLLAVGENIGYSNIKSASQMNKAIVVFLNDEQLVHRVVVEGLTIKEKFVSVLPLSSPTGPTVILSNVPPFIENEKLARELARYGKLMSPIKPILLGCKHPEVKYVLSFRRQAFVLLNDSNSAIDVSWSFNINGVNHTVFANNELMKCFQCGKQGHLRKFCPDKTGDREGGDNGEPSGVVAEPQGVEKPIQLKKAGPAPFSSQSERKACVSTGATPGNEAAIKVVDSMPDKVAAAGKEDAEEGSVMWEDVEEEELSDTSLMMMDETLTSPQGRSKVYSVEQIVSFLNKTKGVRGVVQKEYFPNDQLFIYSSKIAMRKATLNELDQKQRYRLKKRVSERTKGKND
ncbi:hypothetical protein HHUSO_G2538, partial [Huso huso]